MKLVNGASWHTDDSFMREPCSLTMLYGVVVPSTGGDTKFINMDAADEACGRDEGAPRRAPGRLQKYKSSRTNRVAVLSAEEMANMPAATHPPGATSRDRPEGALS